MKNYQRLEGMVAASFPPDVCYGGKVIMNLIGVELPSADSSFPG